MTLRFCAIATVLPLGLAACGTGGGARDASAQSDAPSPIDASAADSPRSLSWVEMAISGCDRPGPATQITAAGGDAGSADAGVAQPCTGQAPLSLRFTAVAPTAIEVYSWTFGDGGTSSEQAPVHVFDLPGTYSVSLIVGGPGGTAEVARDNAIEISPADLGAACSLDGQCGSDRECVCATGEACPAGLERGLCSDACGAGNPCAEGACADLAAANPAQPQDWQRALCLALCTDSSQCPAGLTCQEFPAGDGTGWVQGCFVPGVVGAIGDSCYDAQGNPVDAACASGHCAAIGARGACSALCSSTAQCSLASACGDFADPEPDLCLRRCAGENACIADPWLACEAPGGTGALAFTVAETPASEGYCAPRSCNLPADCGSDGQCTGGYCGP